MYQAQLQLTLQLTHWILTTTSEGSYYFHFMSEETEDQRSKFPTATELANIPL